MRTRTMKASEIRGRKQAVLAFHSANRPAPLVRVDKLRGFLRRGDAVLSRVVRGELDAVVQRFFS